MVLIYLDGAHGQVAPGTVQSGTVSSHAEILTRRSGDQNINGAERTCPGAEILGQQVAKVD